MITLIFLLPDKPKKKRRSQHAKDQVELTLKVSQNTFNFQEDGTEVLPEEETTSTKPVPEGTEDPLRIISSTHYHQDNAQPYPPKHYFAFPFHLIIFYVGGIRKYLLFNKHRDISTGD